MLSLFLFFSSSSSGKVVEAIVPTLSIEKGEEEVEDDEGVENDNDDVVVNKGSETLDKPKNSEKEKVRGDANNAKRAFPKNVY